jgi:hypothetical protein
MRNSASLSAVVIAGLALMTRQSPAQSSYTPYVFTTLAGMAGSPGNADGTGSDAQFDHPVGVAVDNAGTIYVADTYNNTVRSITPAGVVTTLAGLSEDTNSVGFPVGGYADGTGSAARFSFPYGVAVDTDGNVYVADGNNNAIRKVSAAGEVTTLAGLAGSSGSTDGTGTAARFSSPFGVTVDSTGNVYVADGGNNTIRKVTPTGVVTTLAGQPGSSGSNDGLGSAARFNFPASVAVDSAGTVYVADQYNQTIRKVTPAGGVTTLAGLAGVPGSTDGTGTAARFNSPTGVGVDGAGNVYVADHSGNTIRKVTPEGIVSTLAGLAGNFGSADGTAGAALFNNPAGVAVDGAGNLYVADTGNDTIRQGSPALVIRLTKPGFASNGGPFGFTLTGPVGQSVIVEASTDLVNWRPIRTNAFTGALNFSDPKSGGVSNRFYRAHSP